MPLTVWIFLLSLLAWGVRIALSRLVWSPITHIPGPKLAAISYLYEMYYELLHRGGGQFCFKIRDLHAEYGPTVRITPHEVHIDSPDFYSESSLYKRKQADKPLNLQHRFGIPNATFSTPNRDEHRDRRKAIQDFFKKENAQLWAVNIQEVSEALLGRLEEFHSTGEPVNLNRVWGCFTSDIISQLIFEKPREYIQTPDFKSPFTEATDQLLTLGAWSTYFPQVMILLDLAAWLPTALVKQLMPIAHKSLEHQRDIENEISRIRDGIVQLDPRKNALRHLSSFQHHQPPNYLRDEAMSLISAGTETTTRALYVGCFHILSDSNIIKRLQTELKGLKPIREVTLSDLETLPYLRATVLESLRLSYGIHERMTRLLDDPIQYEGFTLPPRTPISTDSYTIHTNEKIFPEASRFKPDRWLKEPNPRRYFAIFGKGPRDCVGQTLARAMILYGFAAVFSHFSLKLDKPSKTDVEFAWGKTVPRPVRSSKGVRVIVQKTEKTWT